MVKPSLKTTSFKHHPVYLQKVLHVDNPFYGPKPQYQRAEVVPGGDCDTIGDFTAEGTGFTKDVGGAGRSGADQTVLLEQVTPTSDESVYLEFKNAAGTEISVDLSWARFIGMWFKGDAGDTYDPGDVALYIFTRKGYYLYANRSRAIDFFPAAYTPGAALWTYKEFALSDFTIASGYGGDRLKEVWGIGWRSHEGDANNKLIIDMIEFYTHGTGLGWTAQGDGGPARGLIMSAPLQDGIYARRGYGLGWDEAYGRVNICADNDRAFAGVCVSNPSRTYLSQDADATDTEFFVVDASLLIPGVAEMFEGDTPATTETPTITAVNTVTNKITVSTGLTHSYTTDGKAFIYMGGNETGNIRVDFLVNGPVNLEASDTITIGHDCSCSHTGEALTVDDDASKQDESIGRAILSASADGEQFPVLLGIRGLAT